MPTQGRLPVYKLIIDKDAEGMDYMGLVDYPAHGKNWNAFSKQTPFKKVEFKQHFNEDKQIVTGVAIATNLQIYRRREDGTEYNVFFTKEDTKEIAIALAENGYMNNVNEMHDLNKDIQGMFMYESFFINEDKSNIPEAFKGQNLQPGSWIVSYKVNNKDTWEKIKNQEFYGFSIEGWFKEVEVKFTKQKTKNKKMEKKSLFERLFGSKDKKEPIKFDSENKDKYAEAVTVDGRTVLWDGELSEGVSLFVQPEEEGAEPILAEAGEFAFPVDGIDMVVTVDEAGMITSVVEAEEMENEEEDDFSEEVQEAMEGIKADYEKKFNSQKETFEGQLKIMAKAHDDLKEAFEKSQEGGEGKEVPAGIKPGWKKTKKK